LTKLKDEIKRQIKVNAKRQTKMTKAWDEQKKIKLKDETKRQIKRDTIENQNKMTKPNEQTSHIILFIQMKFVQKCHYVPFI
jgi:hypothetical protein